MSGRIGGFRWRGLVVMGVAVALVGCQNAAVQAPSAVTDVDHADQAKRAMAAKNWSAAVEHLRLALQREPQSVYLHSSLAISASWLDAREEATREFEWVRAHTIADSEEGRTARSWLAADSRRPAAPGTATSTEARTLSTLHGKVVWAESQERQPMSALRLVGQTGTPAEGLRYEATSTRGGQYEFRNITGGTYELLGTIDGALVWRLKVDVPAGDDVTFDMTRANSVSAQDSSSGS